jgi:hypothetical protein
VARLGEAPPPGGGGRGRGRGGDLIRTGFLDIFFGFILLIFICSVWKFGLVIKTSGSDRRQW